MVNSFCCFRLQTAGVVIGWIGAALSLFNVASYIVLITKLDEIIKDYVITNGTDNNNDNNGNSPDDESSTKTMVLIVVSIYLTLNIINCVASVLLVTGSIKERHLMLVPWLINSGIALTYSFINIVGFIVFYIVHAASFASILLLIITAGIIIGFQTYAWLAVYSLFKMLRAASEQQRLIPNKAGSAYPSYTRI